MTKILHGLTLGLNLFYKIKISFTKTFEGVTLMPSYFIKNKLYKDFRRSNTNAQLLHKLNHLQEQLNFLINRSEQNYYARMTRKLTNVSKNYKAYWSLLRHLLDNKKTTSNSSFVS